MVQASGPRRVREALDVAADGPGGAWRYKTYGGWVAAGAHDVVRTPGPPQARRRLAWGPGSSPWQRACGCWQCDHDRQTHRAVEAAADTLAVKAG